MKRQGGLSSFAWIREHQEWPWDPLFPLYVNKHLLETFRRWKAQTNEFLAHFPHDMSESTREHAETLSAMLLGSIFRIKKILERYSDLNPWPRNRDHFKALWEEDTDSEWDTESDD